MASHLKSDMIRPTTVHLVVKLFGVHNMKKISDEFHNELWVGVNAALARTENYHSDGAVNWSYVDADVYMHMAKQYDLRGSNSLNDKYVTLFEKACDIIDEMNHLVETA